MNELIYVTYNSLSVELCHEMINMFELEDRRYEGLTIGGVNKHVKDTTDFSITSAGLHWDRFNKTLSRELARCIKHYVKTYSDQLGPSYNIFDTNSLVTDNMQLQKYNKGVGKYTYHNDYLCDFDGKKMRKLTFLWYLNDVDDGGETEFWSNCKIKPETGKLILFPASWTHPHRAHVPISSDKYIITGWLYQHY